MADFYLWRVIIRCLWRLDPPAVIKLMKGNCFKAEEQLLSWNLETCLRWCASLEHNSGHNCVRNRSMHMNSHASNGSGCSCVRSCGCLVESCVCRVVDLGSDIMLHDRDPNFIHYCQSLVYILVAFLVWSGILLLIFTCRSSLI